jgi:hypothetical protein
LKGLNAHYHIMRDYDYKQAMEILGWESNLPLCFTHTWSTIKIFTS